MDVYKLMVDTSLCFTKSNDEKEADKKFWELFDNLDPQQISDGYHTFEELYYHRMVLFSIICNIHNDKAFKSWHHAPGDGLMYDDYFVVGVETPKGQYTYHYHKDHWDMFDVKELEHAPVWDKHMPSDVLRLIDLDN